ncbi:MAG: NAD(P)H-dependent glycerol-3-phosphate dehydrogenase [Deltaproteobacteria bacterium]|nr:NAD(P)H-dependent glycerol-3-phosphate dehydrogenase [Deltaproteobacteria bacterium]
MDIKSMRIGVVGAGSWGTAIASLLGMNGFGVDLWALEQEVADSINDKHENNLFLSGLALSENVRASTDLTSVVSDKKLVVIVVPSHVFRDVASRMTKDLLPSAVIVSASKGIENKTHLTMSGIMAETFGEAVNNRLAVLSGPSFAREVAVKVPTVVTAASVDAGVAKFVQEVFAAPYFRVYTNSDVIGVELGAAVKNVIAIASGIVDGLGLGLNTRAALITRGLAEIQRLGVRLSANPHTFAGLSGVGDLILTCTGTLSRNHTVGKMIGEGKTLAEILSSMRMVAEGVKTAHSVYNLSNKLGVEMPISHAVYAVLYEGLSAREAVYRLMTRNLKDEFDS